MRYVLCLLLLITAVSSQAEHSVSIGGASTYFNDPMVGATTQGRCLAVGAAADIFIHITNDGSPECFYNPSFGFVIHDNGTGGTWTWPSTDAWDCIYGYEHLFVDTTIYGPVYVLDSVYFDRGGESPAEGGHRLFNGVFRKLNNADGAGADSIGFAGLTTYGIGLYEGLDADALAIRFTPNTEGSVICIDIAPDFLSYEWGWSGLAVDTAGAPCNNDDIYPDWGGPVCYTVGYPIYCVPSFDDCSASGFNPSLIEGTPGEALSADFCAIDPNPGGGPGPDGVFYTVDIGEIDANGHWEWTPDETTPCTDIWLNVTAQTESCWEVDSHRVRIVIAAGDLQFESGCSGVTVVTVGEESTFEMGVAGGCPGSSVEYSTYYVGDVLGVHSWNDNVFSYTPASEDVGYIELGVAAVAGEDTARCTLNLVCIPVECCGIYTEGYTGNINLSPDGRLTLSDITTLINHVYISKKPLWCPPNGNTNGSVDGFVTLSDITVLIDHVYISKNPTATCQ